MHVGYIYEFYNTEQPDDRLIGATTNLRSARSKLRYELRNTNSSRQPNKQLRALAHLPHEGWQIEVLETVPFETRAALKQRVVSLIRSRQPTLNIHCKTPPRRRRS
jgi:hypothetical protein